MKEALIVIDMQNDFCPKGALPVEKGDQIVPLINRLSRKFDIVAATMDWHPKNHVSFAENHGKQPGETLKIRDMDQTLWPVHCVQGTPGAQFHPDLETRPFNLILRKGAHPGIDSYSAFMENDRKTRTGLGGWLRELDVKRVFLAGLALDYCVFYSAMDAAGLGFDVHVIEDASRGVDFPPGNVEKSLKRMKEAGIQIISSGRALP